VSIQSNVLKALCWCPNNYFRWCRCRIYKTWWNVASAMPPLHKLSAVPDATFHCIGVYCLNSLLPAIQLIWH